MLSNAIPLVHYRRMRRASALLAALAALGLIAAAAPATAATKTVSGDIIGSDLKTAVDVFMGFELVDSAGRNLKADGSLATAPGYAITLRLNQDLSASGAPRSSAHTERWAVTLPANTVKMYIEAYPRNAGQYGTTNDVRFGRVLRRFATAGSLTNVHLRMPLQCKQGGGTGVISGSTRVGGVVKQVNRISAFSISPDNNAANPILGFNIGTSASNGTFTIPSLAPGKYRIFAKRTSSAKPTTTDVNVGRCATTRVNVNA